MENYKEWLLPSINIINKITEPLHYKIEKIDEKVKVFYKGRHNSSWKLLEQNFLSYLPNGSPSVLKPDYSEIDTSRKLEHIQSLQRLFKNTENILLWKKFYESLKTSPIDSLTPNMVDQLPRQHQIATTFVGVGLIPAIREMLTKETREPEVMKIKTMYLFII